MITRKEMKNQRPKGAKRYLRDISVVFVIAASICSTYFLLISVTTTNSIHFQDEIVGKSQMDVKPVTRQPDKAFRKTNAPASTKDNRPNIVSKTASGRQQNTTVTVAYVISLIKCGDHQSNPTGLFDAATVLRHSIHMNSVRNPKSGSKYDYKMYAIVHKQAEKCSHGLRDVGFEIILKDRPVERDQVDSKGLRAIMHKAWCCGHDEFIKLYVYQMKDPIVVHMDIDYIIRKPLDNLFDVLLDPSDEDARTQVERERPEEPWPKTVNAFMTRDWGQVVPGRTKPGYQAGFIALKPDPLVFDELIDTIKHTNYTGGFGIDNGWGSMGYGAFVGAAAMQGLLAYYYDVKRPDEWVELNQCRHNHMGMDIRYRSQPNFIPKKYGSKIGKCRNNQADCEDCMITDVDDIYSIHYTQCRKPWNCIGESKKDNPAKENIPHDSVNPDHCMQLMDVWHSYRQDLENKLFELTKDDTIKDGQKGEYKKEFFHGHCLANFGSNYLPFTAKPESLKRIPELYL